MLIGSSVPLQMSKVSEKVSHVRRGHEATFDALLELFPHLVVIRRGSYEMCVEGENRKPVYIGVEPHPRIGDSIMCTGRLPNVPMKIYGNGTFEYAVDI